MMLETMLLSHISFILGLAIDYISNQCLVLSAALAVSTRSVWALLANTRNMPKQVKIAATTAAVNEGTNPQVLNTVVMGARRYDATLNDGSILEGMIVLFKDGFPVLIDGEPKIATKKWFAITSVVDALIMSADDSVAARVTPLLDGDYMSLRGAAARISIFDGEDGELHYKLEF